MAAAMGCSPDTRFSWIQPTPQPPRRRTRRTDLNAEAQRRKEINMKELCVFARDSWLSAPIRVHLWLKPARLCVFVVQSGLDLSTAAGWLFFVPFQDERLEIRATIRIPKPKIAITEGSGISVNREPHHLQPVGAGFHFLIKSYRAPISVLKVSAMSLLFRMRVPTLKVALSARRSPA
jgi:hypothetical protein